MSIHAGRLALPGRVGSPSRRFSPARRPISYASRAAAHYGLHVIDRLYHSALEREPSERAAFLAQACQSDEELRRELDELLAQESSSGNIIERPAADLLADSTVTQLTAGRQLGPYKIEAPLGAGGMGVVYRALDTRLDRAVAIKISAKRFSAALRA